MTDLIIFFRRRIVVFLFISLWMSSLWAGEVTNPFTGERQKITDIQEQDGAPLIYGPETIEVSNGTLTEQSGNIARVDTSGTNTTGWTRTSPYIYPTTITDNVGIGTTAPLGLLQVGTSPTPGLFVTTAGNVGIGKTSPAQKLDVAGTVAGTTITGANVTSGADPGHTHSSSSITEVDPNAILTDGTRGLSGNWNNANYRIATLGNVGVGTTNPNAPLTVIGAGFISGNLGIGVTNPQNYALYVNGSEYVTGSIISADQYTVTGNIGATGNVGAGTTSPAYRLDIRGSGNAILDMTSNVGIGTTAPTQKLDVIGNIRASGTGTFNILSITNAIDISSQTNLSGDTENVLTGDALSIGSTITRDTEWNGLDFLVGTATGTLSGEIVAGTAPGGELGGSWASPTIDDSLSVTSWTLTTPILSGIFNTDNNWLSGDGGAEGLMIDDSGNLGIGTTGPGHKLEVNGTARAETFNVQGWTGLTASGGNLILGSATQSWSPISIYAGGSEKVTITSAGNVGIGTTGPDVSLEIAGVAAPLHLSRDGNTGAIYEYINNGGNTLYIGVESTGGGGIIPGSLGYSGILGCSSNQELQLATNNAIRATILGDGNVGIGTTGPGALLEVNGTSKFSGIINTNNQYLSGDGGAEGVYVADDGNVGIGTTNPSRKFEVKGLIKDDDTRPLYKIAFINPTAGTTIPGAELSITKSYVLDKLFAYVTGGTNVVFNVYGSPTPGTGPYYNLAVGQTAPTTGLVLTSFSGSTVPSEHLVITDIIGVGGTVPGVSIRIFGHEQ